jgi:NAD(P)-dependent dehydrogenase (short-subunit alcohol dehydrogenase family)
MGAAPLSNLSLSIPSKSLSGKTALITGASSGLGAQFARLLAGQGATVICAARRLDRLTDLVTDIVAHGGKAHAVDMDVSDEASVIAGFDTAERVSGAPSIVLANAGLNTPGLAVDIDMADYDEVMNVNLRGVFVTAREGARRMIASGSQSSQAGRIVLIASMAGLRPLPGVTPYSVSKAGVVMMAKSLAREWANKGINVNAICPGYIETEINADWLAQPGGEKMIAGVPRRRVMAKDALDGAVTWLVSDAAKFTTGAIVQIDDAQGI